MAFFYMYLVLVVLCCLNLTASNQPYFEDESRLTTDLLKNYVVTARPALKASDAVVVSVFPDIRRIDGIDEGIDTLSTSLQFAQKWNDPRLVWNKTDYGNISKIHLPIEQIWRPDIQLYNPAPEGASGIDEFPVVVHSTGEVWYTPFVTLNSYCALNLKYFPYDIQVCTVRLGSWLHHEQEMKIEFWGAENQSTMDIPSHNYGHQNSEVLEHPSWSLIDKKGKGVIKAYKFDCCEEKWLALEIILRLQRARQFYQYVLVGPGVILALLVPLQFLMPPSSTQRSLFGVILILANTIFMTSMKQYFPFEHSSVPRVGVFFIATMSFAAMAVFLSTSIASVDSKGKHRRAIPAWLSQVCLCSKGLRCLLCVTSTSPVNSVYNFGNSRRLDDMQEPAIKMLPEPDTDQALGDKEMSNSSTEAYLRSIAKSTEIAAGKTVAEESLETLNAEWKDLAKVLDRLCFFIFLILFLISVIMLVSKKDEISSV